MWSSCSTCALSALEAGTQRRSPRRPRRQSSPSLLTKAQRDVQAAEGPCTCAAATKGARTRSDGERRANCGRKVCVQKATRLGLGTGDHEGGSGGRARYSEELKRRIRLVVARVRRRARVIGEALPCEEVGLEWSQRGTGIRPAGLSQRA